MKLIKTKLCYVAYALLSYVPRKLPAGVTAYESLATRVYTLSNDVCSLSDVRHVLSTSIIRFNPDKTWISDRKFVNLVRNAAAKQVAGFIFQSIQNTRKAQEAAELAAQQTAEATAPTAAASDGEKTQNV